MARQLIEAIRNGDQLLAKSILLSDKYGCIDCQTARRDGTALFWACAKGLVELVHLLISKGANVNARTNYNSTPLIAAADRNRHQIMRLLLSNGADVNAQTSNGDTACHLAAYRGHREAVLVLVRAGADTDVTNSHFRTPCDEAVRQEHITLIPYLDGSKKTGRKDDVSKVKVLPSRSSVSDLGPPATRSRCLARESCNISIRRDSIECLSENSLSRESSYEEIADSNINGVDLDDRIRSRDPDFGNPESSLFSLGRLAYDVPQAPSSGHQSFSASDLSGFRSNSDRSLTSIGTSLSGLSTASDLCNDLSLISDRTSAKKNFICRLNIPAS